MTSLAEMFQTATALNDTKNQNSPEGLLAGIANSALTGFNSGRALAAQDKAAALDRAVKLIDIQKKTAEMQNEAQNAKISANMAKRLGLVDLTPAEQAAARTTSFNGLGGGAPSPTDHTSSGKMSAIFNSAVTPYNVPKPKWNPKEGLTVEFEKDPNARTTVPKDPSADQARIRTQAEEAARREKFATISSILPPEQAQAYSNIQPTEDEVQKYIPELTAFQQGDTKAAKQLMADRKKAMGPTNTALKAMQDNLSQSQTGVKSIGPRARNIASSATGGLISPSQPLPGLDSDTLKEYRDQIFNGATINDITDQIGSQIKKLSADPKANREKIVDLVKQKLSLSKLSGGQ